MALRLIVTGAGGWIGREVAQRAQSLGLEVVALDTAPRLDGPWIAYRTADIATDTMLSLASDPVFTGAVAVVHCAGYAHRPHETPGEVARFHAINCDGTGRVIELARRVGVDRIVYLSSIAFYDWTKGGDFDESGPEATSTAYAASKLAGEQLCRESVLDWRVARLGTVFGTGDKANFAKLADAMSRRRFLIPGRGEARKSVLPITLAAELLVDLALRDGVPYQLVNLALPVAPTLIEICDSYSRRCGFPRSRRIPLPLLRALACAGDWIARVSPGFPLTSANVRKLTTSTTVKTGRMVETWPGKAWGTFDEWLARSATYYQRQSK